MSAFSMLCDRLRNEATLAKSNGAGDALVQVLETGAGANQFSPIGAPVASPTDALHRARAQSIQDAAFLTEMKQAGVAPADLVMLDGVLESTRGMADTARAPAFAAVRAQVQQQASLSPAARGINWDE